MATEIADAYVQLWPSMSGMGNKIASAMDGVDMTGIGNSMGGKLSQGISTGLSAAKVALGNVVANVASAGISEIAQSLGSAVSRVDTLNQFPKIMSQLGVSTDESSAAMERLDEGVQGLPTALDTVVSSAQGLYSITGDIGLASDAAIALNDAFLASGSSAADASRGLTQMTQMLAKGKVDGQSWNTVVETMGPSLQRVAESLGYTSEKMGGDFYTALQNGEVSMDQLLDTFIELDGASGGFAETAKTASNTIDTAMANVQTAITRNLGKVIDAFYDDIKDALNWFSDAIDAVGKHVVSFAKTAKSAFSGAKDTIVKAFDTMKPGILDFIDSLKQIPAVASVLDTVGTAVDNLKGKFSGLSGAMGQGILTAAENIGTAFSNLGEAIKNDQSPLDSVSDAFDRLYGQGGMIPEQWAKVSGAFDDLAKKAANVPGPLGEIYTALSKVTNKLSEELPNAVATATGAFTDLGEAVKAKGVTAFDSLRDAMSKIPAKAQELVESLKQIPDILGRLKNQDWTLAFDHPTVTKCAQAVKDAADDFSLTATATGVMTAVFMNLQKILTSLARAFPGTTKAASALSTVFTRLTPIGEALGNAVGHVMTSLGKFTTRISGGVLTLSVFSSGLDGIKDALSRVSGAFGAVTPKIGEFLGRVPVLGAAMDAVKSKSGGLFSYLGGEASAAVQLLGERFSGLSSKMGTFAETIGPKFEKVGGVFDGIASRFSGAFGKIGETISKITGNTALQSWGTKIGAAFGVTGGEVMGLVGKFMKLLNPIGSIISSFITMMVTDNDYRTDIFEIVKSIMSSLWPALKSIATMLLDIAETIFPVIMDVIDQLTPVLADIAKVFLEIVDAVAPLVTELIEALAPVISEIVKALGNFIEAIAPLVVEVIEIILDVIEALMPILEPILQVIVTVLSVIGQILGALITVIINIATVVIDVVTTVIGWVEKVFAVVSQVFQLIGGIIGSVMDFICGIIETVVGAVVGFFQKMANGVGKTVNNIFSGIRDIFNKIWDTIIGVVSGIVDKVVGFFQNIVKKITGFAKKIKKAVSDAFQKAIDWITSLPEKALQWGKDIIQGIIDGITGMIQNVTDAVSNVAGAIGDFLGFSEPKKGPLKNFHTFMPDMIDMLCDGMLAGTSKVSAAASKVSAAIDDQMQFETPEFDYKVSAQSEIAAQSTNAAIEDFSMAVENLQAALEADGSITLYLDGQKVATTIATPMNRALATLSAREGI